MVSILKLFEKNNSSRKIIKVFILLNLLNADYSKTINIKIIMNKIEFRNCLYNKFQILSVFFLKLNSATFAPRWTQMARADWPFSAVPPALALSFSKPIGRATRFTRVGYSAYAFVTQEK